MLFTPDTNLKMGTYYLKQLSDELQGKWEAALASYNAGKSHVNAWLAAGNYREPAEFVESIPFNETRAYVQSVMRNAEVYRKLYGAENCAVVQGTSELFKTAAPRIASFLSEFSARFASSSGKISVEM